MRSHWDADTRRTPDFRAQVWRRIESSRAASQTWGGWLTRHLGWVAGAAVACIAVAMLAGAWAAGLQAERQREAMIDRYLSSINPHTAVASADGRR